VYPRRLGGAGIARPRFGVNCTTSHTCPHAIKEMLVRRSVRRATRANVVGLVTALFISAGSTRLGAQTTQTPRASSSLRGTVRDSVTGAPLRGAVVTALDSSGATSTRTIADADGKFSLGDAPRAAHLRLVRIGYRPREVAIPSDRAETVQITMSRLPPLLEAVRVSDSELCPGSTDRGAAFELWEQARAGLLATIVARETKPADATALTFDQALSPSDKRVLQMHTTTKHETTTRPFVASAAPPYFARHGYMVEDADASRVFSAPDADVLLDESFAATHCFRRENADGDHHQQTGVAFTPVTRGRDTLVDVAGVIWLDDSVPQIRSLDFRYTALEPAAIKANAGGHLDFRTMANGVSFIERWWLRLPVLELTAGNARTSLRVPAGRVLPSSIEGRQKRTDARVAQIMRSGGIVLDADWADGTEWHAPPTGVHGALTEKGSTRAIAHAIVSLDGTSISTLSGDDGSFVLAPVVPGRYTMSVIDTTLRGIIPERTADQTIDVEQGRLTDARLELASISAAIGRICRDAHVRDARAGNVSTIILGHLALPDPGARGITVRSRWFADAHLTSDATTVENAEQVSDVDDHGRFMVCGAARERNVRLSVLANGNAIADTIVHVPNAPVLSVQWHPSPRDR
jgi:carboxypeptidase family protein